MIFEAINYSLYSNTFASESKGVIMKMFPAAATELPNLKSLEENMKTLQSAKVSTLGTKALRVYVC